MTDEPNTGGHDAARFEVRATSDSHFGWIRTRLSLERTLMAWVRTATALIGFGFTIVQFFERLHSMDNVAPATRPQMPRYLGLALIASGVISLMISVWQYRWVANYLRSPPYDTIAGLREGGMETPLYFIVIALIFIGLFAFSAVLMRFV
jgi:putative membrane protein